MAQLIRGTILPIQHQERLLFMDCFGKRFEVYINIAAGADREATITDKLVMLSSQEDDIKAYALAAGADLTADLANGAEAIAAEFAV